MSSPAGKGQTVIVVDGGEDVRAVMAIELRMSSYQVIEVKGGREAVELPREHCPPLIFMDIHLPGMGGLTATRLLRKIKEQCDTSIVALSAFSSGD